MNESCLKPEELALLPELAAADPQRRHLADCPRCRALLAAYGRFVEGLPAHEDAGAEARLDAFVDELLGSETETGPGPEREPAPGTGQGRRPRLLAPALALLGLVILGFAYVQFREMSSRPAIRLRDADSEASAEALVLEPARRVSRGGLVLAFSPHPAADAYRLRVYAADLRELAVFELGPATSLDLNTETLARLKAESETLIWRAEALSEGDRIALSEPGGL